jgi:hypothetical protein
MTLLNTQLLSKRITFALNAVMLFCVKSSFSVSPVVHFRGLGKCSRLEARDFVLIAASQLVQAIEFFAKLRIANPFFFNRFRRRTKAAHDENQQANSDHRRSDRRDPGGREFRRQGFNRCERWLSCASRWQRRRRRWWTREVHSASGTPDRRTQRLLRHIHPMRTSWA